MTITRTAAFAMALTALLATAPVLLSRAAAAQEATAPQTTAPATPAGTPTDPLPPEAVRLDELLWLARPLIVFADSPQDPGFQRQMQLLAADPATLADRQVLVIADTDPAALSDLRRRFRPNGFAILLIDTNGRVLLTRPTPRPVREIAATVDKSPQRRQELQDRRSGG